MALQSNAQLLDELMGKNRNAGPGARMNALRFDDDDVCKFALCGFCPHDLFVNTRADLGPCNKIHDETMRTQYEKSSRYGRLGYEDDYEHFLRGLLMDVERKIKRGIERLKLTQSETANQKTPAQLKEERIAEIKEQINAARRDAEQLGEEGQIDEAQAKIAESEKLKADCKYLETQLELTSHQQEQKQMEVCDVCGSFLIINDAQSRIEEHISGKQHMGYARLRQALEDVKKRRADEHEKRRRERDGGLSAKKRTSSDRDRDRDRERDRDRDRDRERRSHRSRDKDSRDRHHHKSDRDRDHERNGKSSRSDRDKEKEKEREKDKERSERRRSRSPTSNGKSANGSSSSSSKDKERESKKRTRSRSGSRERTKSHRSDKEQLQPVSASKLEEETDEFLKLGNLSIPHIY